MILTGSAAPAISTPTLEQVFPEGQEPVERAHAGAEKKCEGGSREKLLRAGQKLLLPPSSYWHSRARVDTCKLFSTPELGSHPIPLTVSGPWL